MMEYQISSTKFHSYCHCEGAEATEVIPSGDVPKGHNPVGKLPPYFFPCKESMPVGRD